MPQAPLGRRSPRIEGWRSASVDEIVSTCVASRISGRPPPLQDTVGVAHDLGDHREGVDRCSG